MSVSPFKRDEALVNLLADHVNRKYVDEIRSYGKTVLVDVGGKTGDWSKCFNKDCLVYNLEVNEGYIDNTVDGSIGVYGDVRCIPFDDESVDIFLCRAVLHHVAGDLDVVCEELCRCLKSDGMVLVVEPCKFNPVGWVGRRFFRIEGFHEDDEHPFNPFRLKSKLGEYFRVVDSGHYFLLSYCLDFVYGYLGLKSGSFTRWFLKRVLSFEQFLLRFRFFQLFSGYVYFKCVKGDLL